MIYTCARCKEEFEGDQTDEEANAEAEALWGVKHASTNPMMAVVCDDCFQEVRPSLDEASRWRKAMAKEGAEPMKVIYPCGCKTVSEGQPPLYCPDHGSVNDIPQVLDLRELAAAPVPASGPRNLQEKLKKIPRYWMRIPNAAGSTTQVMCAVDVERVFDEMCPLGPRQESAEVSKTPATSERVPELALPPSGVVKRDVGGHSEPVAASGLTPREDGITVVTVGPTELLPVAEELQRLRAQASRVSAGTGKNSTAYSLAAFVIDTIERIETIVTEQQEAANAFTEGKEVRAAAPPLSLTPPKENEHADAVSTRGSLPTVRDGAAPTSVLAGDAGGNRGGLPVGDFDESQEPVVVSLDTPVPESLVPIPAPALSLTGLREQEVERWRTLYLALAWMLNDYSGVNGISVDFTQKHAELGDAHEGYHNARIVMKRNKPPVPEGMQQGIRCKCWAKERGPRHEHYDEPPYSCARGCGCKAYDPASPVAPPHPTSSGLRELVEKLREVTPRWTNDHCAVVPIPADVLANTPFYATGRNGWLSRKEVLAIADELVAALRAATEAGDK